VGWKEDYSDPKSDVALYDLHVPEAGMDTTVSYMRTLKRAHPPGTVWNYSTGETNLVGVLVARATDKSPAQYLSERIWAPYGMEQDATWLLGSTGLEMTGCCIQASTRDFARFGQFIMEGGVAGGAPVLPAGWLKDATRKQAPTGTRGLGYGYQWWTWDDGSFQADGIFGQGIFIDPARQLVIASNSNWTSADGNVDGEWEARNDFYRAVQRALDTEAAQ
jgi:CubicO group peptidase (beta-lactamase class C family)